MLKVHKIFIFNGILLCIDFFSIVVSAAIPKTPSSTGSGHHSFIPSTCPLFSSSTKTKSSSSRSPSTPLFNYNRSFISPYYVYHLQDLTSYNSFRFSLRSKSKLIKSVVMDSTAWSARKKSSWALCPPIASGDPASAPPQTHSKECTLRDNVVR